MERTFFPSREYWFTYRVIVSCWVVVLGWMIAGTQTEGDHFRWRPSVALWYLIAVSAVYLSAAAVYAVLVSRRKRLVINEAEVCSHGPLFVRAIRFADVIKAWWLPHIDRANPHPRGIRLRTARRELVIYIDHFVQRGAEGELIALFRDRLDPAVWQDWETFQAVREGRASRWSPPVFTVKRMWRMLATVTGLSMIAGAAIGLLLQIRTPDAVAWWASAVSSGEINTVIKIPGAVKWPWSGWLPLDWSVGSGLLGLVIVSFFSFLEWVGLKWRTFQRRRSERAISQPPPNSQ